MSATAQSYAYRVTVRDKSKPEPVLSREELEASIRRVEKYVAGERDGNAGKRSD